VVEPGQPPVRRLTIVDILKFSMPRKQGHGENENGSAIGSVIDQQTVAFRCAVDLPRFIDVVAKERRPARQISSPLGRQFQAVDRDDRQGLSSPSPAYGTKRTALKVKNAPRN